MNTTRTDVLIVGAGASGLAAGLKLSGYGYEVTVIERDSGAGGILNQCIHNGFGLHYFHEELTGPEFADRLLDRVDGRIRLVRSATATTLANDADGLGVVVYSAESGITRYICKSIVLAMGCRERNRGNIHIPGTRPSGIFTAGLAQRLVNIEGHIPGEDVVIVGSGDIGLIMARRMSWIGARVHGVVEIQPYPSGITRNIVQCLNDFGIPLYLSHVITGIRGASRVESVEISPLEQGHPVAEKSFEVACDTILLSVGLIPENELSRTLGIEMNKETGGPLVDADLMTSHDGVFACGNVLHVHDLVDYACEEAERCADGVHAYISGTQRDVGGSVAAGAQVRYVVPSSYDGRRENRFYLRPMVVANGLKLLVRSGGAVVAKKALPHVQPSEMVALTLRADTLTALAGAAVEVSIE
jgi:thioredoxin reductase